ncbi:uncharacterized protein LOC103524116 [Trichonephila clavipes]|nr:uncharacterized protein LOC103524116 [Trichonephila clavipes]
MTLRPGHLRYASANLPVHKQNSLLAELRSADLATIEERYPNQDWLHGFTASFGRTGAGASSNSFNLKEPLSACSDNFDGEIYVIFMAFRAISTTPGLNFVILIDSQAAIKTAHLATIYSHQNLSLSAINISTHFFAPEERSFSNGSHLIAAFMEMNKPTHKLAKEASTLHSPCLPMPLGNAKRLLRDKLRQKRIFILADLTVDKSWSCLLDDQRRAQLSFLPRVEGVA